MLRGKFIWYCNREITVCELPDAERQRYIDKFTSLGIDKTVLGDSENPVDGWFRLQLPHKRRRRHDHKKLSATDVTLTYVHTVTHKKAHFYFYDTTSAGCSQPPFRSGHGCSRDPRKKRKETHGQDRRQMRRLLLCKDLHKVQATFRS